MKNILVINSSARTQNSHSRKLTEVFVNHWTNLHENPNITYREIGTTPVPHIDEKWISAAFTPAERRTADEIEILKTSSTCIAELRQAAIIVLAAPMYNWSISSSLKAYIDQVLRVNETFKINIADAANPYVGLLENKTLFLLAARGANGYENGESNEHLNFQTKYLKTVFNMMGIYNIHLVTVDGTSLDALNLEKTIEKAHQDIQLLIEQQVL